MSNLWVKLFHYIQSLGSNLALPFFHPAEWNYCEFSEKNRNLKHAKMSKCLIARVHIGIIWGFREKRHIEPNLEPTRACAPIFYFGNSHICMNWIARNGKIYEHTLSKCYSSLRLNALKYWTTNSRTTLYIKCNKLITWKIYSRWALCDSFSVLVSVRSVVFFCGAFFATGTDILGFFSLQHSGNFGRKTFRFVHFIYHR